jgi:TolB-like protein
MRDRLLAGRVQPRIESLAVLPLQNLSSDPAQDYFADGMTDGLITEIARIGSPRVISRTSTMQYKGARKPLPVIAKELGVDAVVEGTITHSGHKVRITAKLIRAGDDRVPAPQRPTNFRSDL